MAYRRNNKQKIAWREWLRRNQNELDKCGLPAIILTSEMHWWDFLMHGYLDHHEDLSKFTVDDLSYLETKYLKDFLESELTPEEKQSAIILSQLEKRLNDG